MSASDFYEVTDEVREFVYRPEDADGGMSDFRRLPAGTWVELTNEKGQLRWYLVGHMNRNSGQCDCCNAMRSNTTIRVTRVLPEGAKVAE